MNKSFGSIFVLLILAVVAVFVLFVRPGHPFIFSLSKGVVRNFVTDNIDNIDTNSPTTNKNSPLYSLTIESLRKGSYPGSPITIEQTLEPGSNYERYVVSFVVQGLKEYALLTIPNQDRPPNGYPAIIFNHGYIPPTEYRTTERYVAYVDGFARNGFVVMKPDYRGHGSSEGAASGAYGSPDYVVDVLNAVTSLKHMKKDNQPVVDPKRLGMWGHSMGGYITLRSMVVNDDIRAGVIWGGVVGSYEDIVYNWRRIPTITPDVIPSAVRRWRQLLIDTYGGPKDSPDFWNSISATSYVKDISGPLQLHHGEADTSVPVAFSQKLETRMKEVHKDVELFTYPGDDHNISNSFSIAMQRSIDFFKTHLK